MPDRIALRDVAVEALIGVFEHERRAKRPLVLDLDLSCDLRRAAASDDLADTVDYASLVARVRERCAETSYRLIESLADDVARVCLAQPHVLSVTVTVRKPGAVPGVGDVAVAVERGP
jgi:dihydroneopterin aldolase